MNQHAIPVDVSFNEISRERDLGGAITLCLRAAGLEPKEVHDKIKIDGKPLDKGQFSRWISGGEGIVWPKFVALMDGCGNDAPLLWMNHARGYDIASMRKRESQLEADLRKAREENAALRRVLMAGAAS